MKTLDTARKNLAAWIFVVATIVVVFGYFTPPLPHHRERAVKLNTAVNVYSTNLTVSIPASSR